MGTGQAGAARQGRDSLRHGRGQRSAGALVSGTLWRRRARGAPGG